MSEPIATIEERIKALEDYIASQVTRRFDDVQDENKATGERVNEYYSRTEKQITRAEEYLREHLAQALAELRAKFYAQVEKEIRKVSADEIADALTKKILVTRPATRGEVADVVVRNASIAEIRNQQ